MKIIKVQTRDNRSDMRVVATECSYNFACSYLESLNADNSLGKFIGALPMSLSMTEIKYENKSFYYDEDRGYLLTE